MHTHMSQEWLVVNFKKPVQLARGGDESWCFNPNRRYILNTLQVEVLKEFVDTVSPLKTSKHYRSLNGSARLHDAKILIERYRDRGAGDLLFLTGPLKFIYEMSGGSAKIDFYSLSDRASLLVNNPALPYGPLAGPTHYDDLPLFTYHWFIDHVTEHDEEVDQHNVYDCLFQQIGVAPEKVPDRFKRPSITLVDQDFRDLDGLYMLIFSQYKVDLRMTEYFVVAPLTYSNLRAASYKMMLQTVEELAKFRPVVVVGRSGDESQVPTTDMPFGTFNQAVNELGKKVPVFNLMGTTQLRTVAALIARARVVVSLDSGLLYVAQGLRIPAVSLWGTHAPHSRLKYDPQYMKLAIWPRDACAHSPCFAYAEFPRHKCPRHEEQKLCEVMFNIQAADIIEKVALAEKDPR